MGSNNRDMASKTSASTAVLLSFNLLFFATLTSIPSSSAANCNPEDFLKLRVCADVLKLLVLYIGPPASTMDECCGLIGDLVKLEVDVCLCTALKLNVLSLIKLNIPELPLLNLLLSNCKPKIGRDLVCE